MIPIILMVFGAGMALVGFLGLFALMVEPLYSMYMIIFKREDDYVYYETKHGKALLQKNIKSLRGSCLFLFIVGLLIFGLGWFLKYGPRGTDSLLSEQVESGASVGDDETDLKNGRYINASGNYVDENGVEHQEYIIITGTDIKFKGSLKGTITEFEGSYKEFEKIMKNVDNKEKIALGDIYASSKIYYMVEDFLNQ